MFLFIYTYIEIFWNIIYSSIFKNKKDNIINFSKKNNSNPFKNSIFNLIIFLNLLNILFLKVSDTTNFLFSLTSLLAIITLIFFSKSKNNLSFLLFNVSFFINFFFFINTFVLFFIYIELYSILFYFFFLNDNKKQSLNFLQYKNMLLLYLFNNFFSTILFLIGLNFLVEIYGTVNFTELSYFDNNPHWQTYFIILSFIVKLSLPGLHFLKIEVYKYLTLEIVIVYSVITLLINYIFLVYLFNQNIIYHVLNEFKLMNILLILSFFVLIQKTKVHNFQEFIAYSGFATNNLIILNYLIKKWDI
jgi:hypothetical protein